MKYLKEPGQRVLGSNRIREGRGKAFNKAIKKYPTKKPIRRSHLRA